MRTKRERKLTIRLTEDEHEAWHRASGSEGTAIWVRQLVNQQLAAIPWRVREERVEDSPPEEDDTNPEVEDMTLEEIRDLYVSDPEFKQAADEVLTGKALDPECPKAALHWQLPRDAVCAGCGGRNT